jgi:hypothetical protein
LIGVTEALVLTAFRQTGVPLQRIRPALERLREDTGLDHALASSRLFSDGAEVLYNYAEQHPGNEALANLTVVFSGQRVLAGVVRDYPATDHVRLRKVAEQTLAARVPPGRLD